MTREEFTFTIGFQGDKAIVDKRARRQYGRLSTLELAEKGLYRAAFCSAVYSNNEHEMADFIRHFAQETGSADKDTSRPASVEQLKRLFGVHTVPDEIKRVVSL